MNREDQIESLLKALAEYKAEKAWVMCWDVNGESLKYRKLCKNINRIQKGLEARKLELAEGFNNDEIEVLFNGDIMVDEAEQEIEKRYRPTHFYFNQRALRVLTRTFVPEDIQMALSFGHKFLFPYIINDNNIHKILAQLEMTIEEAIPDLQQLEASIEICRILKDRSNFDCNGHNIWLKFICYRAVSFFKKNPHIFAIRSDKGGHTVIMDVEDYKIKLTQHLSDDAYAPVNNPNWLETLILEEIELVNILMNNKRIVELMGGAKIPAYEPHTLTLPKFYGLPKIHKNNCPLRPITSTIGAVGYQVSKIFYVILKRIFPKTEYHIKDSYELVNFLNKIKLRSGDILVSFDVVSMYTSIPFQLVYKIVMNKAALFSQFSINKELLSKILIFSLKKCMIFTALDDTYKQNFGLPMGSCLSPLMARIVMDEVIIFLLGHIPDITFIRVFVDDTIVAINRHKVDDALCTLNNFLPDKLKFTLEHENDSKSINFLNMTLIRERVKGVECICTNWHRKSYASGRLLNYYTSHKRSTILATAAHFIKTVLLLSSPKFFLENKQRVIQTLRENSFPENVICALMSEFYTYMKPLHKHDDHIYETGVQPIAFVREGETIETPEIIRNKIVRNEEERYVIFPHSIYEAKKIKKVIHRLRSPGVILADSVKNTKINSVTTRKTITPGINRKNMIISSQCICNNKCIVTKTNFNETAGMVKKSITDRSVSICGSSRHAYKKFKFHRGLCYGNQTEYLLRYVQWKHRHKLDMFTCRYTFPNNLLNKMVKCSCCK